ncbi:MAG: sulfotransferase [Deltaproteobacteria bacterium]|nr:sulfotransferase [Deltaproteobacteria bacterium]MBI3389618.1 sulfotransferase [Deltaproteobacteria bacterium]
MATTRSAQTIESMESRLLFVIGPPRSGSTLLMRMLSSHSAIYSRPEPHLLTPLAHLGYYETVDAAPFDHLQAAQAAREFVADLPRGEQDYLDACRAYTDVLYGRMLAARGKGKPLFLDKTPANGLILPFIAKLYPNARYVVLTRHPAAVFSSFANSFFDSDYEAARKFNPILNRYVPAMARFLRKRSVPLVQVGYEQLVQQPEIEMRRVCEFLDIAFEPRMIEYGEQQPESKGLGDPVNVDRHTRPVTESVEKWASELALDSRKLQIVREMIETIDDGDLSTWGFPRATIFAPVEAAAQRGGLQPPHPPALDRFQIQRKLLVLLRRNIQQNAFGRLVRRVRLFCDVLLRG